MNERKLQTRSLEQEVESYRKTITQMVDQLKEKQEDLDKVRDSLTASQVVVTYQKGLIDTVRQERHRMECESEVMREQRDNMLEQRDESRKAWEQTIAAHKLVCQELDGAKDAWTKKNEDWLTNGPRGIRACSRAEDTEGADHGDRFGDDHTSRRESRLYRRHRRLIRGGAVESLAVGGFAARSGAFASDDSGPRPVPGEG